METSVRYIRRNRSGSPILDTFVDSLSLGECLDIASGWANSPTPRTICFCNVHALVTASVRADLAKAYAEADLVLPDGAPVAWMLRLLGHRRQKRISGPDFMWQYCQRANQIGASVYLYGNRQATLDTLASRLKGSFPDLQIAGMMSPPYRPLTQEEDDAIVETINASGARVCFVSLGCPKQELWITAHQTRVHTVMLGVGAAFDYHAGNVRRPPMWVRNSGFEWLCRLFQDPKRLWKRYLLANSIFAWRAAAQALDHALNGREADRRAGGISQPDTSEPER